MRPGALNQLITIERPTRTRDAGGDDTTTWEPVPGFVRIQAAVIPDGARETFAARQVQSIANALVRIWFQPGIDATMRVCHHVRPGFNEYWDIAGPPIDFESKQREMRLTCLKRDAEGWRRGEDLVNT